MSDPNCLAQAFRRWGYLQAQIDDLGRITPVVHPDLEAAVGTAVAEDGLPENKADYYRGIYCGPIGLEFMHIPFSERIAWLIEQMERPRSAVNPRRLFERLLEAELFEKFIHTRYVGAKRFSLEGSAVLIPLLDAILNRAADVGVRQVFIGMSHRGRLTTMHLIAGLPAAKIFASFEDAGAREVLGSGDVKYHRGVTGSYSSANNNSLLVRLSSNPSHLEAINPVVVGRVRGEQERLRDNGAHEKVLAIVIHGDAAFAGQGITAETLNLAELRGFTVGGTVNIVVNNLVGFTAQPESLHSSRYATSVALRLPIPIFHVNGERPEEVARVGQMALDYRNEFHSEVVIDLIGYRRFGHNEADDPTVTSPVLYRQISQREILYKTYGRSLGMAPEEITAAEQAFIQRLEDELKVGRNITHHPVYFRVADYWLPFSGGPYQADYEVPTAVAEEQLIKLGEKLHEVPGDFSVHPKLRRLLDDRLKMVGGEKALDWGAAEALSFASLLSQGIHVRLVGQDSCRGTFSHRHAVLYDYGTGKSYIPLDNLGPEQGRFAVYDSSLSEAAAVGFEYGFSRQYPEALVCWEAQFGDFVNGAQIIIDQFISAGEDKWGLLSGLVLLLPHGYEGMGPEHSSARIERFLQLAGEDNFQVCQPSTAGQYFHLLRRQVLRKWRKPLIVFTPKSMLRMPAACSAVSELSQGRFFNVLRDLPEYNNAKRLLFCSGKIAHELRKFRSQGGHDRCAIITIEQFYPFPLAEFKEVIAHYSEAAQALWVQEEPANMGALFYVKPILESQFGHGHVWTVKRSASASPATGSPGAHQVEQSALIELAFAGSD